MCYIPHPSHPLSFYIFCISTFKVNLPANEMTGCGGVVVCDVVVWWFVVGWCVVGWCVVWWCVV
jgi:hypothetical protein